VRGERGGILGRVMKEPTRGPPEDTFLGDTDPRSKPTLGVSRADEMLGRYPGLALNAALGCTRMRPAEIPDRRRLPEGGHCGREFDVIR
jgi:hypothetical protein